MNTMMEKNTLGKNEMKKNVTKGNVIEELTTNLVMLENAMWDEQEHLEFEGDERVGGRSRRGILKDYCAQAVALCIDVLFMNQLRTEQEKIIKDLIALWASKACLSDSELIDVALEKQYFQCVDYFSKNHCYFYSDRKNYLATKMQMINDIFELIAKGTNEYDAWKIVRDRYNLWTEGQVQKELWEEFSEYNRVFSRAIGEVLCLKYWLKYFVSTGIHDGLTYGYGQCCQYGFWQFPISEKTVEKARRRRQVAPIRKAIQQERNYQRSLRAIERQNQKKFGDSLNIQF